HRSQRAEDAQHGRDQWQQRGERRTEAPDDAPAGSEAVDEPGDGRTGLADDRGKRIQRGTYRPADRGRDRVLGDLPLVPEGLADLVTGSDLRLRQLAGTVLHHREDVIDADLTVGCHLLDDVPGDTEPGQQGVDDRAARLADQAQRVVQDDAAVVDALEDAGHGAFELDRAAAGADDRHSDVVEDADGLVALDSRVGERLRRLAVGGVLDRRAGGDLL